ncbi:MAG: hypothetical protein BRD55_00545 [Bacteroidetes bacterium SW_9_63_38]|nr:MAG: hypothetical protein BRD55_00545 [Bacteroidetes bacterium SW_9_63_38]
MRDEVVLDAFVVMPNHMHGIVCLVPPDVDDVSPRGYDLDMGPGSPRIDGGQENDNDVYIVDLGIHGGKTDAPSDIPNL